MTFTWSMPGARRVSIHPVVCWPAVCLVAAMSGWGLTSRVGTGTGAAGGVVSASVLGTSRMVRSPRSRPLCLTQYPAGITSELMSAKITRRHAARSSGAGSETRRPLSAPASMATKATGVAGTSCTHANASHATPTPTSTSGSSPAPVRTMSIRVWPEAGTGGPDDLAQQGLGRERGDDGHRCRHRQCRGTELAASGVVTSGHANGVQARLRNSFPRFPCRNRCESNQ